MRCPICGFDNLPGVDQCEQCLSSLTQDDIPQAQSGVERSLMEDPVACLRPARPFSVDLHTSLADALALLRNQHIGCVLVTDQTGALTGILTERDLLQKVVLEGSELSQSGVEDFMSSAPETGKHDHPLGYAIQRMIVSDIRYLPLVDDRGRPTGIVSSHDLIAYIAEKLRH